MIRVHYLAPNAFVGTVSNLLVLIKDSLRAPSQL